MFRFDEDWKLPINVINCNNFINLNTRNNYCNYSTYRTMWLYSAVMYPKGRHPDQTAPGSVL